MLERVTSLEAKLGESADNVARLEKQSAVMKQEVADLETANRRLENSNITMGTHLHPGLKVLYARSYTDA